MNGSVTIIICTRDNADSLRDTLVSIGHCVVPPDLTAELLVVDNGSSDHTAQVVHDAGLTNLPVRYVVEPAPGQTRARNAGLRASAADMVLFTDDDVRVPTQWIEGMCRPVVNDVADAVAGTVHFPAQYEPVLAKEPFRSKRGWLASNEGRKPDAPGNMVGANMAFNRRVIEALREFDTELGPGALGFYDDTLFTARLVEAGFRLVAALDISVEHRFNLSRLTRQTFLGMAERMGKSEAYVTYHWEQDEPDPPPWIIWRAWLLRLGSRLRTPWNPLLGRVAVGELQRVQTLAYWQQLARMTGTPRHYQRPVQIPTAALSRQA